MNELMNNRLHKNIFRKIDLECNENMNEGNDNILTNISIIEDILQRTKKEKNCNLEATHKNDNVIEKKQKSLKNNNITQLREKTNVAKFFIGDEDDYQNVDEESFITKNNNLNYTNIPFQCHSSNILSKSLLNLTNLIDKNSSILQTYYSLSKINIVPSCHEISKNRINKMINNTNSINTENEKYNNIKKTIIINIKKPENFIQHVFQSKIKSNEISNEIKKKFIGLKKCHSYLSLKSLVSK